MNGSFSCCFFVVAVILFVYVIGSVLVNLYDTIRYEILYSQTPVIIHDVEQ